MKGAKGFTLIEVLVYLTTVAIASALMVSILMVVLRVQTREFTGIAVTQESSFVMNSIQRLVRESSVINMPKGVAVNSLDLCLGSSVEESCRDNDKTQSTRIYLNEAEKAIYLKRGNGVASRLTSERVIVDEFTATKYENPKAHTIVQVNLALKSNTLNPEQMITRKLRTAIARVNAVTFDSNLVPPNTASDLSVGTQAFPWRDAYFSGNVGITNKLTVDTDTLVVEPSSNKVTVKDLQINGTSKIGVGGYLQLDTPTNLPSKPDTNCDNDSEKGRMFWTDDKDLFICAGSVGWWKSKPNTFQQY